MKAVAVMDAYREDLAFIHESGHTKLARGAASILLSELSDCESPGLLVELGCGGGTLAEIVSAAGHSVLGFDISASMIEMARRRVPDASFVTGSFLDVTIPPCVAVAAIGEVINYLFDARNNEDILGKTFRKVFDALQPGGFFLFDSAGLDRAPHGNEQSFREHEDWTVLVTTKRLDDILERHITSFRRIGDLYRRDHEVHRLRLYDPQWIAEQLALAGFEVQTLDRYGDKPMLDGLYAFFARRPITETHQT